MPWASFKSEAQGAKHGGQVGGIQLALRRVIGRQDARQPHLLGMVHHVLQGEEAGDVGFGFFNGAVKLFQFGAGSSVPPVHLDLVGPEAVHQFVGHGVGEK